MQESAVGLHRDAGSNISNIVHHFFVFHKKHCHLYFASIFHLSCWLQSCFVRVSPICTLDWRGFGGCYLLINVGGLAPSLKLWRCPTVPVVSVSEFASRPFSFCSAGCRGSWGGRGSHPASTGVEPWANGSVWCAVTGSLSQSSADSHFFFFPPPLRPSREVVLVTSLAVNNSFQWDKLAFCCGLLHPSGTFTI